VKDPLSCVALFSSRAGAPFLAPLPFGVFTIAPAVPRVFVGRFSFNHILLTYPRTVTEETDARLFPPLAPPLFLSPISEGKCVLAKFFPCEYSFVCCIFRLPFPPTEHGTGKLQTPLTPVWRKMLFHKAPSTAPLTPPTCLYVESFLQVPADLEKLLALLLFFLALFPSPLIEFFFEVAVPDTPRHTDIFFPDVHHSGAPLSSLSPTIRYLSSSGVKKLRSPLVPLIPSLLSPQSTSIVYGPFYPLPPSRHRLEDSSNKGPATHDPSCAPHSSQGIGEVPVSHQRLTHPSLKRKLRSNFSAAPVLTWFHSNTPACYFAFFVPTFPLPKTTLTPSSVSPPVSFHLLLFFPLTMQIPGAPFSLLCPPSSSLRRPLFFFAYRHQ